MIFWYYVLSVGFKRNYTFPHVILCQKWNSKQSSNSWVSSRVILPLSNSILFNAFKHCWFSIAFLVFEQSKLECLKTCIVFSMCCFFYVKQYCLILASFENAFGNINIDIQFFLSVLSWNKMVVNKCLFRFYHLCLW